MVNKESIWERTKWWLYHPRLELIYLLGGVPNEHHNTMHYRNVRTIVDNIQKQITQANAESAESAPKHKEK